MLKSLAIGTTLLGAVHVAAAEKNYGPGVTDTEIKLGQTAPYSGARLPQLRRNHAGDPGNYFRMINASGGINGRKINLISLDDAYSAAEDRPNRPASTLSTATRCWRSRAHWARQEISRSPNTSREGRCRSWCWPCPGSAKLSDPEKLPWTTTFYASQTIESGIYARYILENKPTAKIAVLYQNDDYGKGYFDGFKAALGDKASLIVAEASYDITYPTIESELVRLASSGADTIFFASTPKFTAQALSARRSRSTGSRSKL